MPNEPKYNMSVGLHNYQDSLMKLKQIMTNNDFLHRCGVCSILLSESMNADVQ